MNGTIKQVIFYLKIFLLIILFISVIDTINSGYQERVLLIGCVSLGVLIILILLEKHYST